MSAKNLYNFVGASGKKGIKFPDRDGKPNWIGEVVSEWIVCTPEEVEAHIKRLNKEHKTDDFEAHASTA